MNRLIAALFLFPIAALAQMPMLPPLPDPPPRPPIPKFGSSQLPFHWVEHRIAEYWRLQAGTEWTPYTIGESKPGGPYTLYNGTASVASGPDLAPLKAEGIKLASPP